LMGWPGGRKLFTSKVLAAQLLDAAAKHRAAPKIIFFINM